MKSYLIKMMVIIFLLSSFISIYKEKNSSNIIYQNTVYNNLGYKSEMSYNNYETLYDGLTIEELGNKLDNLLGSTLDGKGKIIAELAIEKDVDPYVATAIILHETGCKWTCSALVRNNNNVGGMRSSKGYMKFATLELGIEAFINNLAKNYYAKGLNTPELINKKYATNKEWYKSINYYINLIKAS